MDSSALAQRSRKHHQELAQHEMHARHRAAEDGLHGAALFLSSGQVHRRVHGANQAQHDDEVGNQPAEHRAADFFRRCHILFFHAKRLDQGLRQAARRQPVAHRSFAEIAEEILQAGDAEAGTQLARIHVNAHGGGLAAFDGGVEIARNLDGGANPLVRNLRGVIGRRRHDADFIERLQRRQHTGRILAAQDHHRGYFLHGPAHHRRRQHPKADGQQRHQQDGHGDHGNDRAAVAQGIDQFLAIHHADVACAHDSTALTKISSRSCCW